MPSFDNLNSQIVTPFFDENLEESILFVLDMTSGLRFEMKREIIRKFVIFPILKLLLKRNRNNAIKVSFASLTGSINFGLSCQILKSFAFANGCDDKVFKDIEVFLVWDIDKIVDFGIEGESLIGSFGIAGIIESICTALCHFQDADQSLENSIKNHLILLPTSAGTELLPPFRTCRNDQYFSATIQSLLSEFRAKKISLSLVAPGLTDSTVVEQFIVFKCNEKIGNSKLINSLGPDWVVRLSAALIGEEESNVITISDIKPKVVDDNEMLSQILIKLSAMPPEERVNSLKNMLDPATSTFSSSFRQKFAAAVKSRLQLQESSNNNNSTAQIQSIPASPVQAPISRSNSTSFSQRRASHDSSTNFWSGCIRFLDKQQSYLFRTQFIAVDTQSPLPRASIENWPQELNLTGLLDSKKESIQAGLSVGYAFKVNVANADSAVALFLMQRMCQGPTGPIASNNNSNNNNISTKPPSHLACFRISQDVLIMLRVLSLEDLQFVGYLIDRRFPKNNLSSAGQAASNAINSLTSAKSPMSTTLSTGMDSLSLMNSSRRPSLDVKMTSNFSIKKQVQPQRPQLQSNTQSQLPQSKPMPTNYISYPQFIQQQQQHLSPVKIAAISTSSVSSNQLLTDPQAILQKHRPAVPRNSVKDPVPIQLPTLQPNESVNEDLDQSFIDAWLN